VPRDFPLFKRGEWSIATWTNERHSAYSHEILELLIVLVNANILTSFVVEKKIKQFYFTK